MNYTRSFQVNAPLETVVDFHSRSSSMGAITPPPVIVRVHSAPEVLQDGDEMDFTLWLGPFPIRWRAQIEDVSEQGFVDRQLDGPFAQWEHTHSFIPVDPHTTRVIDEIQAEYRPHWFWRLVGMGMWINMPVLFAFRAWKTKRLLGDETVEQRQRAS